MRVDRQQARENRNRVVAASSALFREMGIDGVGIADLMSEAGLTHGGFYKQFASKAALVEEACTLAVSDRLAFWKAYIANAADPRAAFVRGYLSNRHRDSIAEGCVFPALAGEAVRQPQPVRDVFTQAIRAYADLLDAPAALQTKETRAQALSNLAQMVGAVLLARVSNDDALSQDILEAARSNLLSQADEMSAPNEGHNR